MADVRIVSGVGVDVHVDVGEQSVRYQWQRFRTFNAVRVTPGQYVRHSGVPGGDVIDDGREHRRLVGGTRFGHHPSPSRLQLHNLGSRTSEDDLGCATCQGQRAIEVNSM